MKVYRLTADIDRKYAQIHSQMEQEPKEGITVMWDDWLVKGNIIPDFIFSVYSISKTKIIEDLQNRFNGLEKIKLLWEKNPKEEVAKNIHGKRYLVSGDKGKIILPEDTIIIYGHTHPFNTSINNGPSQEDRLSLDLVNDGKRQSKQYVFHNGLRTTIYRGTDSSADVTIQAND